MPDYSQAKIYHIVCNLTGETYYGSTVQKISQRMGTHRKPGKDCCSKPIIERGDYHYGLVEDYKCDNLEQLLMRERYYVDNNDCINKNRPITSKEEKIAQQKVYRDNHKEKKKAYREANKDKMKAYYELYSKENKEKKKAYREANKDKIIEQKKGYYETNKDKISEHKKEKVICECGCEISRTNLSTHRKTKFHQEFIQSLASGGNTI